MRLLRSVLLASSCLLSSVSTSMLDGAAVPDVDGDCATTAISPCVSEVYTMGFEAETSVFKIPSSLPSQLLRSRTHKWEFTSDTPDNPLTKNTQNDQVTTLSEDAAKCEEEDPIYWEPLLNTEAKTIGGLDHESINRAAKELMLLWEELEARCKDDNTLVDINIAEMDAFQFMAPCEESIEAIQVFKARTKDHHNKRLVYPQITYCFPISRIDELLQHLSEVLDSNGSTTFCKYLFRDHPVYADTSRAPETIEPEHLNTQKAQAALQTISRLLKRNKDSLTTQFTESLRTKKDFLTSVYRILEPMKGTHSASYGLGVLFVLYAYSLFVDGMPIVTDEPGPKSELGLMSRLSFSEIYDSFLNLPNGKEEQEVFKFFVTKLDHKFLNQKIRTYKTCSITRLRDENRVTIKDWLDSIVSPDRRIKGRDLLSPPPECVSKPPYAMGLLSADHLPPAHIILEVRAYSRVKVSGFETTLDNFESLINTESDWFFNKLSNPGES